MLTQLIEDYQDNETANAQAALQKWNTERDKLRLEVADKDYLSFCKSSN